MPLKARSLSTHFVRRVRTNKLDGNDYRLFRSEVREDFRATCGYCLLEEKWAAGRENFELDHFRPQSLFPQLAMSFHNLYWSCHVCNNVKRGRWPSMALLELGIGFVDLCASNFSDHFVEQFSGKWRGKNLSARYTIDALRLNRPHLVELRRILHSYALIDTGSTKA